jgi:hypothetical protein
MERVLLSCCHRPRGPEDFSPFHGPSWRRGLASWLHDRICALRSGYA